MTLDWSKTIPILAGAFFYGVWLFVSSERGEITLKGERFEKAKDPAGFKFQIRLMIFLGLALTVLFIYLFGLTSPQP